MKKADPEIKFPCKWEFRLITDSSKAAETEAGIAALEAEPGNKWKKVSMEVIVGVVAGIVGIVIGKLMGG